MAEEEERREAQIQPVTENEAKTMKPWEQHASVISIPRFDYNAPSALFHHSHSGFLITCSIKREKSATKEAMLILEKYLRSYDSNKIVQSSDANASTKRRKLIIDEICQTSITHVTDVEINNIVENADNLSKDEDSAHEKKSATLEGSFVLSLVKLIRSGLVLLTFVNGNPPNTVDIVSDIFQRLESKSLKSPIWCHRVFPILATCHLNEKELRPTVSKLVHEFITVNKSKITLPIKFAVGYNRRGIGETQLKAVKDASNNSNLLLLNRNKCFDIVASAIKDAVSDSVVDLNSPDLSVLVELLPLSAVPRGSFIAAVSVLPRNLVSAKPRLCIRPLISDPKDRTGNS
ncbi:hypothetical protein K2173_017187 [Erythroxylum novogranatense]|uniref:THUMP domain-containing protein n=1 Tax=Erythroxylum novogranatense TaxID=1862640 RepID=A0AAV8U628_9ROSI|nr:hypothetical protein K2173_017187 [Erythroxylum novogranatense]